VKKATRQHTKAHNARLVLKLIYDQGEISRADIARATRLTRPTVSSIVDELIENEFVIETGRGPSAGGKRPTLLSVAHDAHQLLCIDLGSHEFRGAVANLRGEIQAQVAFPLDQQTETAALALVYDLVDRLAAAADHPILGIGIGTPGLVDPVAGVIRRAVNLNWNDLPLRDLLAARYDLPVYVANDSHMAALAEYTFGPLRDSKNLIVIKIGRGVGAGIVLHGQPFYGDGMGAGEIGHVVVEEDGRNCTCGNAGCLETVAGTAAMMAQADMGWEALVEAYDAGDPAVVAIVQRAANFLGRAIANLVGSLNVHHVALAGRVNRFGPAFLAWIQAELQQRVMPSMAADTQVSYSAHGAEIVMLGCSAMILNQELGII
jgi:N-acetylglucosamine repressor